MIIIAGFLVLTAFVLAYWGVVNAWEHTGKALAAIMAALVLLGAAVAILHQLGR